MTTPEPMAYIAVAPCGCTKMAVTDRPEIAEEIATEIAACIKAGYTVEHVTCALAQLVRAVPAQKTPPGRAGNTDDDGVGMRQHDMALDEGRASEPIVITVAALPPSANHMYITCKGSRKALSAQTELFRALVLEQVSEARPAVPDGPLALTVRLWFGDRRKCDIDNRLKAAIDALALALRFDDSRIHEIHAVRAGCDPGRPRCEMVLVGVQW